MKRLRPMVVALGTAAICLGAGASELSAQLAGPPAAGVQAPGGAATLGRAPAVRIGAATESAARRALNEPEIRWDHLLANRASEPYTYLVSEPGTYVRYTRINSRVTYVEHVRSALGRVTWRGELRVAGAKP